MWRLWPTLFLSNARSLRLKGSTGALDVAVKEAGFSRGNQHCGGCQKLGGFFYTSKSLNLRFFFFKPGLAGHSSEPDAFQL